MSVLARAAFVLLVAASFAAFFVAQRLKSTPQVATITTYTEYFSPDGDGRRDRATVRLRIRRDDDVTVTVVDEGGTEVRRLGTGLEARRDEIVRVVWDGRTDGGEPAPDGRYYIRVSLRSEGRAATLGNRITVDTRAPNPTVLVGGPDGTQWITGPVARPVPFRVLVVSDDLPTEMEVRRTDLAEPQVVARFELPPGERTGEWDGRIDGTPAPPGTYQLVAAVTDVSGNVGRSAPEPGEAGEIRGQPGISVRRLLVQPPADPVRAGERAEFAVDSRGRPIAWAVRRAGSGEVLRRGERDSGGVFPIRAPEGPSGLHVLTVVAGQDRVAVPFAVQGAEPAPLLVVLPAVTWFGSATLDDDRDGLPNTLASGASAGYPRLLDGPPAGFATDQAALLAFLDEQNVRYDLTTDLALAASRSALSEDRRAVLLAGPLRWVPNDLARRLRRYVQRGGRVASFGADTLRRGVEVGAARLVRPLPPTPEDPFGAELRELRTLGTPTPLIPIADEGGSGLLTGVQSLPGFTRVEESSPAERVQVALAAVDEQALEEAEAEGGEPPETLYAVTLSELGEGLVIRVGLPDWGARVRDRSVPVLQLTRNIADVLRGFRPEIRSFR